MSLAVVTPEIYESQLLEKSQHLTELFADLMDVELELFRSQPEHYRMRAEFRIWHYGNRSSYCMFDSTTKKPFEVTSFPSASVTINQLMMPMMEAIIASDHLRKNLFQVEFLTTQTGEALISLLYHRQLDGQWQAEALALQTQFGIKIIGRARKQKLVLAEDFVTETLTADGREFHYTQVENSFTQPNAGVNEHMLSWAAGVSRQITATQPSDLLELYCGNGNFTCVLAQYFNKVLATEVSKTSVKSAKENFRLNGVENVAIARLSSEEFTQAMNKTREFKRLKELDLDSYQCSTIFVDPPRAGLDEDTEKLVQNFDHIIYISCNPETLKQNLENISATHKVVKAALFDQFPYTHHAEMGVYLARR